MHRISGRIIPPFFISGIRPDTRLPCRISGIRLLDWPDIRPAGYPAKTVSGASLEIISHYKSGLFRDSGRFVTRVVSWWDLLWWVISWSGTFRGWVISWWAILRWVVSWWDVLYVNHLFSLNLSRRRKETNKCWHVKPLPPSLYVK
jgi:hypothetical protein